MKAILSSPLYKYGLIFAAIPVVATYVIGHIFKVAFQDTFQSMADMPLDDPDKSILPIVEYIFPFALICGLLAFIIWVILMKNKSAKLMGIFAGLLTVFLAYPVLGLTMGLIYPDATSPIESAFTSVFFLTFMGNVITFWFTYPIGAICGGLIAKRMLAQSDDTADMFT
jgi:hypothetical protein